MIRLNTKGTEVTTLPHEWSESDCEIVATNFNHPSITEGQHTNGPAAIWIRQAEVGEWLPTYDTHMQRVRAKWVAGGLDAFQHTGEQP